MRILLTGGAGFIASHIADAYLALGHEVLIVDDLSTGRLDNVPSGARWMEISILAARLTDIFSEFRPEVVNHHAAQIDVGRSVADPVADAEVNVLGSLKILEAARRTGVRKVIFASSGGAIYGEQAFYPADEGHPETPRNPYGITKLTIEKYLQFYSWEYGIPFTALRYANVYGPRQNHLGEAGVVAIFTNKLLRGESPVIFGDGLQTRDYVFVEDVVACNVRALEPGVRGIFNVGTGVETDVVTIAALLKRLTGSAAEVRFAAPRPGEQRRSSVKPGALQPKITPLEEGLKKTVAWFRTRS